MKQGELIISELLEYLTYPPPMRYFYGLCPSVPRSLSMVKATAKAAETDSPPQESLPASFELALNELEAIVKAMEGSKQLALEESLAAYQRGMTLLRYCQDALATAEQKIQILENDALRDSPPAREE